VEYHSWSGGSSVQGWADRPGAGGVGVGGGGGVGKGGFGCFCFLKYN